MLQLSSEKSLLPDSSLRTLNYRTKSSFLHLKKVLTFGQARNSNWSGKLQLILVVYPSKIEYSGSLFVNLDFDEYGLNMKIV